MAYVTNLGPFSASFGPQSISPANGPVCDHVGVVFRLIQPALAGILNLTVRWTDNGVAQAEVISGISLSNLIWIGQRPPVFTTRKDNGVFLTIEGVLVGVLGTPIFDLSTLVVE